MIIIIRKIDNNHKMVRTKKIQELKKMTTQIVTNIFNSPPYFDCRISMYNFQCLELTMKSKFFMNYYTNNVKKL